MQDLAPATYAPRSKIDSVIAYLHEKYRLGQCRMEGMDLGVDEMEQLCGEMGRICEELGVLEGVRDGGGEGEGVGEEGEVVDEEVDEDLEAFLEKMRREGGTVEEDGGEV
jgi:hypothetical protein